MAFNLGVTRKLLGNHKANLQQILGLLTERLGFRIYLELVWKCFSIGKIHNLEKNFTWGYSRIFGEFQFPVCRSTTVVENMPLHSFRVNSIYPQSFIQIGLMVSEILRITPKMDAILTIEKIHDQNDRFFINLICNGHFGT